MTVRVVCCGQPCAGDDGVGFAVLDALAHEALPGSPELHRALDAAALLPLLEGASRVVIVDAALGAEPGVVRVCSPEHLAELVPSRVSSHGLGVGQAIELARVLAPGASCRDVRIVAILIHQPERYAIALSPQAAAAVPRAVAAVRACLEAPAP
jgi:hydrogenase maturation protease